MGDENTRGGGGWKWSEITIIGGWNNRGGGEFFHSKGTWGCAARKGTHLQTSSLAKGILFGNFS